MAAYAAASVALIVMAGIVAMLLIAAISGRKIEITRSKITLWPRIAPRKPGKD